MVVNSGPALMNAREVADMLGIPRPEVYKLLGGLALRLSPRRLRWRRADLDQWVVTRNAAAQPGAGER